MPKLNAKLGGALVRSRFPRSRRSSCWTCKMHFASKGGTASNCGSGPGRFGAARPVRTFPRFQSGTAAISGVPVVHLRMAYKAVLGRCAGGASFAPCHKEAGVLHRMRAPAKHNPPKMVKLLTKDRERRDRWNGPHPASREDPS